MRIVACARPIGVPRLVEALRQDRGRLPWQGLCGDAIALNAANLKRDPEAAAYFRNADGMPKALGTVLKNPAYAHTPTLMAQSGANALCTGQIAPDIVAKIATMPGADGSAITPGKTTIADLAAYRAKRRAPVRTPHLPRYVVKTLVGGKHPNVPTETVAFPVSRYVVADACDACHRATPITYRS